MRQPETRPNTVTFASPEILLSEVGAFECRLSPGALESDLSLVIDLYDMDNPVHPQGHLGWWQFPVNRLPADVSGLLSLESDPIDCRLAGVTASRSWVNEQKIEFDRLVVNAVLRANITNAIVYLERVPAFRTPRQLADFRSGLNRDWNQPEFTAPGYIFPTGSTVRIVSRNIFMRDAVGNLCLGIYRMLRQHEIPVQLYCHISDLALNDVVRRVERLADEAGCDDQLLYFHSTYDPDLDRLLQLPCKRRIAYFHGVTAPELLQVFNPELAVTCRKGIEQIGRLQQFDLLAANSRASAARMIALFGSGSGHSTTDVRVIPPRLLSSDHSNPASSEHATSPTKLLYVGRIKSSKRIEHLLELFAAYLRLDSEAELWIVGGGADKAYVDYLNWTQRDLRLPETKVHWAGSVNDSDLAAHYASASAYLAMSEDEGFCLPVFEAMLAGVPVFAYGLPAVIEVMQGCGIYFVEKDFQYLANALHTLLQDRQRVAELIARQHERAQQLAGRMDGRDFLELFAPSAVATNRVSDR